MIRPWCWTELCTYVSAVAARLSIQLQIRLPTLPNNPSSPVLLTHISFQHNRTELHQKQNKYIQVCNQFSAHLTIHFHRLCILCCSKLYTFTPCYTHMYGNFYSLFTLCVCSANFSSLICCVLFNTSILSVVPVPARN